MPATNNSPNDDINDAITRWRRSTLQPSADDEAREDFILWLLRHQDRGRQLLRSLERGRTRSTRRTGYNMICPISALAIWMQWIQHDEEIYRHYLFHPRGPSRLLPPEQ